MKKLYLLALLSISYIYGMSQACVENSNFVVNNVSPNVYNFSFFHHNVSSGVKTLVITASCNGVMLPGFPVCIDARFDGTYYSPDITCNNLSSLNISITPHTGNDCGGTVCGPTVYSQGGGVLPVTLTGFTAVNNNGVANITWQSENERNVKSFLVEAGDNGTDFYSIKTVAAKNTDGRNQYSVTDNIFTMTGKKYYRLKIIDLDGTFSYSNVVQLAGKTSTSVSVYPNPAVDHVNIFGIEKNTTVLITDATGVAVKKVVVGSPNMPIDISTLKPGVYFVNPGKGAIQKFIKQ